MKWNNIETLNFRLKQFHVKRKKWFFECDFMHKALFRILFAKFGSGVVVSYIVFPYLSSYRLKSMRIELVLCAHISLHVRIW